MNETFACIIHSNVAEWEMSINLLPALPALIYGLVLTFVMIKRRKKEKLSFWLYPLLLPSADEREKTISADACRKAFTAIWIMAPVCTGLMCFYPLFAEIFPAFPIVIVLLIPAAQMTVYFVTVRKIYHS
ncbi:DUF2178 domain-containing protein [Sporolactobacillus pectinivorans]|uniref:DUF2178 domain-containing protein n=1 Tax=Sporolactobacillus pectinivorans TaxID=1591408 RepID=UPI000C267D7F|nr:DUF2178 domain-containing protein [Sporolactobacillus pectinivorans]